MTDGGKVRAGMSSPSPLSSSASAPLSALATPPVPTGVVKKHRPEKLIIEPAAGPSTRLSGLMKRIQAKASDCQSQFESFVNNVSSAVHLTKKSSPTQGASHSKPPSGVLIGPMSASSSPTVSGIPPSPLFNSDKKRYSFASSGNIWPEDDAGKMKHTYLIKTATLTPFTMHTAQRPHQSHLGGHGSVAGPPRTWNAPQNKTRPDLSSVLGFRPDKHVTCIEVTLVNNRIPPASSSSTATTPSTTATPSSVVSAESVPLSLDNHNHETTPPPRSTMKTYCFGENPESVTMLGRMVEDKSPCGTMSSRSSSRGSEQFDSGFEELIQQRRKTSDSSTDQSPSPPITAASVMRSIWDRLGDRMNQRPASPSKQRVVQPKRSTIRREKAFRQRNKHAWSRAKELKQQQYNDELLQRFHQIRKRLGEEDEEEKKGVSAVNAPTAAAVSVTVGDESCSSDSATSTPLPSIVQTLVRQYDNTGHQRPPQPQPRSRVKIVPSRLHSRRSGHSGPTSRPVRTDSVEQVRQSPSSSS